MKRFLLEISALYATGAAFLAIAGVFANPGTLAHRFACLVFALAC